MIIILKIFMIMIELIMILIEIVSWKKKKLLDELKNKYEKQTSPFYAAARLWVDDIIDPAQTRKYIAEGINAANHNAEIAEFKTGVIQV